MNRNEELGITRSDEALQGLQWDILGQTYVPKQISDESFAWHATLPPGTFVPPHIHPTQDEYLYILEGTLDFWLNGETSAAAPGDVVRLARGIPHGIYNNSSADAKALFWVTPTRSLFELFVGIDAMDPQTGEAVAALAAQHEVEFLPPAK
ncbi:MAG: cupin domain-containing protein [Conexibacter sp.]